MLRGWVLASRVFAPRLMVPVVVDVSTVILQLLVVSDESNVAATKYHVLAVQMVVEEAIDCHVHPESFRPKTMVHPPKSSMVSLR